MIFFLKHFEHSQQTVGKESLNGSKLKKKTDLFLSNFKEKIYAL